MRLMVTTADGEVYPVEVGEDEAVENVKVVMEVETGTPVASQQILFNGQPLDSGDTLKSAGVKDHDLLLMMTSQPAQGRGAPAARDGGNPMGLNADGTAQNPTAMMDQIFGNPQLMEQLGATQPELASAVKNRNVPLFQNALKSASQTSQRAEKERQAEMQRLMADPLNPENQAKIAEMINQKNVQEAYENALEHNPEFFGSVIMLYVDMEVNGTKIKAFVDSGAQSTIMSQKCAERLGIMRLCDKRFAGIAKGVGTSKIIGRVHQAPIKVGSSHLTASITILEQDDMEFLFGLDMLKRHQCCIDLNKNELRFGSCGESLRFLSEHELPDLLRHAGEPPSPSKAGGSSTQPTSSTAPPARSVPPATPAAAAARAALPTPAGAAATASAAVDEGMVAQLTSLGFSRDMAVQALEATGGNIDAAASMLFGGF